MKAMRRDEPAKGGVPKGRKQSGVMDLRFQCLELRSGKGSGGVWRSGDWLQRI